MRRKLLIYLGVSALLLIAAGLAACAPQAGPPGPAGPPGTSSGTLSGTVTSSLTNSAVQGAKITTDPAIEGVTIQTGADGTYSASLPVGVYKVTVAADGYNSATFDAALAGGQTVNNKTVLDPKGKVAIMGTAITGKAPGAAVDVPAKVVVLDGSTISGYQWTQTAGPKATITSGTDATAKVTLADVKEYKAALLKSLVLLDRTMIQPVNLGALATAQKSTFKLTVTTSSGTYSGTVDVSVVMPFVAASDLSNVPVGIPVLVNGGKSASYSWTLTKPSGSNAALTDADTQNPYFTPDAAGKYTLKESKTGASLDIFAGTWAGALSGTDAKGEPLSAACTTCHDGKTAPNNFSTWKTTGHSQIFIFSMTKYEDYAPTCMSCHTVGTDGLGVKNNGANDQSDFGALTSASWFPTPAPDNWNKVQATAPKTAQFTGIQCENCHGPNGSDTTLHPNGTIDPSRVSMSSDVCGVCHGRPPKHSLFQQWQASGHGNFELASAEGTSTSCARCHTTQGFLTWIQQPDMTKSLTADQIKAANLSASTAQPITCVACHDPHNEGSMVANPPGVQVRIQGDTSMLPSGYQAKAVGKGAICITCHNTRNGARNDAIGLDPASPDRAPHVAAQGDVLMGENAYFVTTGIRGAHSYIEDTCATCHVELTPPAKPYTTAVNHAFSASAEICGDCHGEFKNGENLIADTEAKIESLGKKIAAYALAKLPDSVMVKDYTPHTYSGKEYDVASNPAAISKSNIKSLAPVEVHGRQGLTIELTTPISVTYAPTGEDPHTVSVSTVHVQLGGLTKDGKTLAFATTDPLYKAGWNYYLIEGDGSKGVHNPSWVNSIIQATMNALK